MDTTVTLSPTELELLLDALDAYEYWEVGDRLPRNDGRVFLPGDALCIDDPYWSASPSDHEAVAIAAVRTARLLADRLRAAGRDHPSAV